MRPSLRRYRDEDDSWRIREFLREVMLLNDRRELSWHVARLDYWRWHVIENCHACDPVECVTFLWEAPDGRIVAVLNPEGRGEAHFKVHPDLRLPDLEDEMLTVAEAPLGEARPDGPRKLCVWTDHRDELRCSLLARRGYAVADQPDSKEHQRR